MTAHSVLILGTDAVLGAAPATPVQLIHACQAAGYQVVIPASWGDELIAGRAIERARDADAPLVHCSCPHVADRLAESGSVLGPMLLCLVPPPVAAAEYVRALFAPTRPHITFAGGCPGADHAAIDTRLAVDQLFASLAERGISTRSQPTEFDSVIPADRRRYFSDPGGIPSRHALRQHASGIELVELRDEDVVADLAHHLLQKGRALIDVSLPLGCTCGGRRSGEPCDLARTRVREIEPPRAAAPVVDHTLRLSLDVVRADAIVTPHLEPTPPQLRRVPDEDVTPAADTPLFPADAPARRRSSPGGQRAVLGTMPLARTDAGRPLPRAYVARRRSPPSVKRIEPASPPQAPAPTPWDEKKQWAVVATLGVIVGLVAAWLIRLLP